MFRLPSSSSGVAALKYFTKCSSYAVRIKQGQMEKNRESSTVVSKEKVTKRVADYTSTAQSCHHSSLFPPTLTVMAVLYAAHELSESASMRVLQWGLGSTWVTNFSASTAAV